MAQERGERARSAEEFVYCEDIQLPSELFKRKSATHFLVVDFRPGCAGRDDIILGRRAANAVEGLLRDSLLRVATEDPGKQMQLAKSLEVVRVQCVIKDETAARILGKSTGADMVLWGDAVCPLRAEQGQPLVNITQTVEAKAGGTVVPRDIIAHVELPKGEIGSFCTRATMTSEGWPMIGSGSAQTQSAAVLEGASLELPQVVAGDALGLTLFVGGLHFYKRNDYPHALNLFRNASKTLRTDSKSATDLLWAMGWTEYRVGRFDAAAGFFWRCESLVEATSERWWQCRERRVEVLALSQSPQAYALAQETRERARAAQRQASEASMLSELGFMAMNRYEWDTALMSYTEALRLYHAIGDWRGKAKVMNNLGLLAVHQRQWDTAHTRHMEVLALYRAAGNSFGESNTLRGLGELALSQEEWDTARERFEEALALYRAFDVRLGQANALQGLGRVALRQGEWVTACRRYEEALALYQAAGHRMGEAETLSEFAQCADNMEQYVEADRRYQQATALFEEIQERDLAAKNDAHYGLSLAKRGDSKRAREVLIRAYRVFVEFANIGSADLMLQTLRQLDAGIE